jgi:hypothetical protein
MKIFLNSIHVFPIALMLVGCANSAPQAQAPVQVALVAPMGNAPVDAAPPTFADSELAKLPGVLASMDKCREQNKKHKVITRVLNSGPMKGNLAIEVTCDV